MSRLHSRVVPWLMLGAFLVGAWLLFSVAAGGEAWQLRGVMSLQALWEERPAKGEVRRFVSRVHERGLEAEQRMLESAADALSRGSRRLDDRAGTLRGDEQEIASAGAAASATSEGRPQRLKSHRFQETDTEFKAAFVTDSAPGEGKVYLLRGPSRWVVEFPGRWRNSSHRVNELPGTFIGRVVVETGDNVLRVVFHYADQNANVVPARQGRQRPRLALEQDGFSVSIPKPKEPAARPHDSATNAHDSTGKPTDSAAKPHGAPAHEPRAPREQQTL